MIKLQYMVVGILETNCYMLTDDETGASVIADPGGRADKIQKVLEQQQIVPSLILITHGHIDHYMGAVELSIHYQCPIVIHQDEVAYLTSPGAQSAFYSEGYAKRLQETCYGLNTACPKPRMIQDGDIITADHIRFEAIEVPGHSDHSLCYYERDQHLLIAGDTIFAGGIGRTDLYNGDPDDLIRNIKSRLLILDDDTVLLPGHGPSTTMGAEKQNNPYLKGME